MIKKGLTTLITALFLLSITLTIVSAEQNQLILENKNTSDWSVIEDDIQAVLSYDDIGSQFDYTLTAEGLNPETSYSLIYYSDQPDRFEDWGGAPAFLLGTL